MRWLLRRFRTYAWLLLSDLEDEVTTPKPLDENATAKRIEHIAARLEDIVTMLEQLLPRRKPAGAEVPPDPDHVEVPPKYRGGPG